MSDLTLGDWGTEDTLWGVGPSNDGTYGIPTNAQPVNQPWDIGGGSLGQYSGGVFDLLKMGIGAWSSNKQQSEMLDYKRFEATQGGIFQQGQAAAQYAIQRQSSSSLMMFALIGVVAFIVLKK